MNIMNSVLSPGSLSSVLRYPSYEVDKQPSLTEGGLFANQEMPFGKKS